MSEPIQLGHGEAVLIIVKDDKVIHYSGNMGLPHVEFVKRTVGTLPEGAWVGTIHKDKKGMGVISSKTFYGYQMPAPEWVVAAVKKMFR
ncbi:MAG: hypothetical protein NTY53_18200 [Kiritimatiellaeota bacterium]|nr:hypothetical protein [Kiritimatiellota bacterium]